MDLQGDHSQNVFPHPSIPYHKEIILESQLEENKKKIKEIDTWIEFNKFYLQINSEFIYTSD